MPSRIIPGTPGNTNAATSADPSVQLQKAEWIFRTVSGLTDAIDLLSLEIVENTTSGQEELAIKADTVRALSQQVRLLCCIGQQDSGSKQPPENVRAVILPPVYNELCARGQA